MKDDERPVHDLGNRVGQVSLATAIGADDEPTERAWCRRCGVEIQILAFIVEMARGDNHRLKARGEKLISKRELATCDACRPAEEARLSAQMRAEGNRISEALRVVRAGGRLTRQDFDWLKQKAPQDLARAIGWAMEHGTMGDAK